MGARCVKMSHAHGGDGGHHHNHHHRRHNSNRSKPAVPPAWRSGNHISSSNQGDVTKHLVKIDVENKLESTPDFPVSQKESKGSNSNLPLIDDDDDDFCPTCLEGYDEENPKAFLQCTHHYHLPCIYEWMERSNNCPICDKTMIFA